MAVTITLFNVFPKYIGNGTIDLDTDTFKVSLHSNVLVPNYSTMVKFADVTNELTTAFGYTAGGATLTSVTYNLVNAIATWDAADIVWNASGGDIVAAYACIYKSGTANTIVNPLVGLIALNGGSNVTAPDGKPLTLKWNTSGILSLAVN